MLVRWLMNLTTTNLALRRRFPPATLAAIDAAITDSERQHHAEIRCAIETTLPLRDLLRGTDSTARAGAVFAALGVWDTAGNNGVLLYILLAERKIEIVADRGFAGLVTAREWQDICAGMERAFGRSEYRAGTLAALAQITAIASRHFPASAEGPNELPDRTVLL